MPSSQQYSGSSQPRPLRDALQPMTSALPTLAGTSDTLAIVKEAIMAPFQSDLRRSESMRVIGGLAPQLMNTRLLGPSSASSSQAIGHYKPSRLSPLYTSIPSRFPLLPEKATSTSLAILEAVPALLSAPIDEESFPPSSGDPVSLIQGFKATVPSSEMAKQRRRRVRGGVADEEVGGGKIGLKKLGDQARGLLTEGDGEEDDEHAKGLGVGRKQRKKRRGKGARRGSGAGRELSLEELMHQADEIGTDKDHVQVRRNLIINEIDEVTAKIQALDEIRIRLETSLVLLQEEELELDDELEGVKELMSLPHITSSSTGTNAAASVISTPTRSSRRRKGPAFLPSEHDDLPSGVAFMTLGEHAGPISALDFTEPYGTLVTAGQDDIVRVWDLCDGEEIGRLRGHNGTVKAIQVEDTVCLTGGADGNIRLWDLRLVDDWEERLAKGEGERHVLDRIEEEEGMLGGEEAVEVGTDGETRSKKGAKDEGDPCVRVLEGHSKAVTALYYEEGCLVTGSSDKTIRQWDVNTGQCVLTMDILWAISNPPVSNLPTLPASPRRPGLHGRMSTSYSSFGDFDDVLPSPGASLLGLPGGSLLSAATGSAFAIPTPPYQDGSWEMYQDFVGGVQFWGYALASGSGDGGVRMWDMRTGQAHRTLIGHTGPVTCLQFDETYIVSGSLDKTIRTWDLRMGQVFDVLKYEYPVTALQFDTRKIVACTGENGIEVYNRTSGAHSRLTINGHVKPAERMRFIDRYLVSGGKDGMAKIWAM